MVKLDHFVSCSPATEANALTLEFATANGQRSLTIPNSDAQLLLEDMGRWLQKVRYSSAVKKL